MIAYAALRHLPWVDDMWSWLLTPVLSQITSPSFPFLHLKLVIRAQLDFLPHCAVFASSDVFPKGPQASKENCITQEYRSHFREFHLPNMLIPRDVFWQ